MRTRSVVLSLLGVVVLGLSGCPGPAANLEELRRFPVSSLEGVLSRDGVAFDAAISRDGDGSLRIVAERPRTVRLYEAGDLDVERARLLYRASLRTQDVQGKVYLEMWCRFPGKGEFFSRALHAPLEGTTEWTEQETPFILQAGENPDQVKLNLVIDGTGTVWIDDIVLLRGSL